MQKRKLKDIRFQKVLDGYKLLCFGNLYREGARLRCMGVIAYILKGFQGRGYEQIVASKLLRRLKNSFPESITGRIRTLGTAENYISNCVQLEIVKRSGGYLRLTSEGEALLCLSDFSSVPPPFHLIPLEKSLFLYQILKLDKPCFYALLAHLKQLEEAPLVKVAREINYPTFTRLRIKARLHRIGARLEWAHDLGLVKKEKGLYSFTKYGKRLLLQNEQDEWKIIGKTYYEEPQTGIPEYEWFLENMVNGYSLLAELNPFDIYIDLNSLVLYLRIHAIPKWLLPKETVQKLFTQVWDRNQGKVSFLSSMKRNEKAENFILKGKQFKYIYLS